MMRSRADGMLQASSRTFLRLDFSSHLPAADVLPAAGVQYFLMPLRPGQAARRRRSPFHRSTCGA